MILINFMLIYLNLCSTKGVFRVELYDLGTWFSHFQKVYCKSEFQLVFGQFSISSWSEKGHEPSRKSFSSARTHHYYLPNIGTNPTYPTTCGGTIVNKYILIILWLTQKNIKGLNYLTSTTLRPDELIEIINEKNQPTAPIGPFPVVWDDMHLIIFIFVKALTYFL